MAYGINGSLQILQDPYGYDDTSLNRARNYIGSYNSIHTVNAPIMVSSYWYGSNLVESEEPQSSNYDSATQKGDVVNCIFDVYQISDSAVGSFPEDWTLVASIRKSRDLVNISQMDRSFGGDGVANNNGHIFTIDISEICKDLLSYSLLPDGKGTWASTFYGGLNGGARQQDNLAKPVYANNFILTKNGTLRKIMVQVRTEILDGDGIIRLATASGSFKNINSNFMIINNAPDFGTHQPSSVMLGTGSLLHSGWGASATYPRQQMSHKPNWNYRFADNPSDFNLGVSIAADIRMTDTTEQLTWIQGTVNNYSIYNNPSSNPNPENCRYCVANTSDLVDSVYSVVTAFDSSGNVVRRGRLFDWNSNLIPKTTINSITVWPRGHNRACSQNVSPVFINANIIHVDSVVQAVWEDGGETYTRRRIDVDGAASSAASALFLNDEISYYKVTAESVTTTQGNGTGEKKGNFHEARWYKIDREREQSTNFISSDTYAGVFYTELRSDYSTNSKKIRCKGLQMNYTKAAPFLRLHWLNKAGGIDAYTFKGDSKKSFNATKDVILRPTPDRSNIGFGYSSSSYPNTFPFSNPNVQDNYESDSMRGGDTYNGGLEVLSVNGTQGGTITSRPLNEEKAEWLRELISSPNVWTTINVIKKQKSGQTMMRAYYRSASNNEAGSNQDGRTPTNNEYVPLIITSSSVDIYDSAKGLVTITLEYIHSHATTTQRN